MILSTSNSFNLNFPPCITFAELARWEVDLREAQLPGSDWITLLVDPLSGTHLH